MAEGEWVDGRLVHDGLARRRPAPGGDVDCRREVHHRQHPLRRSGSGHASELNLGSLDALPGAPRRSRDPDGGGGGGSSSMGEVGSRRRPSDRDEARARGRDHSDRLVGYGIAPAGTAPGGYVRRGSAASTVGSGESQSLGGKTCDRLENTS